MKECVTKVLFPLFCSMLFISGCLHQNSSFAEEQFYRNLRKASTDNPKESAVAKEAIRRNGTNALPLLLDMLSSGSEDDQTLAVKGFETLGGLAQPAIPALRAMLITTNPTPLVALCLARIGPKGVSVLIDCLEAQAPRARAVAALGLGAVSSKDARVPQALTRALQDRSPVVRTSSALSLGDLKMLPETVLPALANASLTDTNRNTRFAALRSIGAFGPQAYGVVSQIAYLTNNSDAIIQEAAKTAIDRITGLKPKRKGVTHSSGQ